MLKTKKNITLTGSSVIDGKVAEGYSAIIDSTNPQDRNISSWQQDKALYKENRAQCRMDETEFEELAYACQDEMIAAMEAEKEELLEEAERTEK